MRLVPDGTFRMGFDQHYPEEAPVHRVTTFKEYPPSQVSGTLTVDKAVAMIAWSRRRQMKIIRY
jgi:hypothetical protein